VSLSLSFAALRLWVRLSLRQCGTVLFFAYPVFRFASSGINRETYQRLLLRNGARGNVQGDVAMLRLYGHDSAPAQTGQVAERFCGP